MPVFNGELREWKHFWEIFENQVGQRVYSDQDKLNFLERHLAGPSKKMINIYNLEGCLYEEVVAALKRAYGGTKRLTNMYQDAIRKLAVAKTAAQMKSNLNTIRKMFNNLKVGRQSVRSAAGAASVSSVTTCYVDKGLRCTPHHAVQGVHGS